MNTMILCLKCFLELCFNATRTMSTSRALVLVFSCSFCMFFPKSSHAREFSATGELIRKEGVDLTPSAKSGFEVLVKDCQWMVTFDHPPKAPFLDVQQVGCDGTNIYQLDMYNDVAFKDDKSHNPKLYSRGFLFPGNVPDFGYNNVSQLWFAFASGCYLNQLTTNRITGTLLNPKSISDSTMRAVLKFDPSDANFLLDASLYNEGKEQYADGHMENLPAPYDHGYTELCYIVLSYTNISGFKMPVNFTITVYQPDPGGKTASDLLPIYQLVGTITNIDLNVAGRSCIPQITQRTLVQDFRSKEISNVGHVDYYAAKNWIHETNSLQFANMIAKTPADLSDKTVKTVVRTVFILLLLICPIILWTAKRKQ